MKEAELPYSEASRLFSYDPETGVVTRKIATSRRVKAGSVVGYDDSKGYKRFILRGRKYFVHRLVWLLAHGQWPPGEMDHINRDPSDNRLENLRVVSSTENKKNRRMFSNNKSGVKGVYKTPHGSWSAEIYVDSKKIRLGWHKDKQDAIKARKDAEEKYWGAA